MPTTINKKGNTSQGESMAEQIKADREFIEGTQRGVKACCEGKKRLLSDIKRDLGLQ
jgi:hypothetical protein